MYIYIHRDWRKWKKEHRNRLLHPHQTDTFPSTGVLSETNRKKKQKSVLSDYAWQHVNLPGLQWLLWWVQVSGQFPSCHQQMAREMVPIMSLCCKMVPISPNFLSPYIGEVSSINYRRLIWRYIYVYIYITCIYICIVYTLHH